jgi:hypothetical protein
MSVMTKEQEDKLDELLELLRPLNKILVRINAAEKQLGFSKGTLSKNDKVTKYEEVGHKRTYVEIGELRVVKKRRKKK